MARRRLALVAALLVPLLGASACAPQVPQWDPQSACRMARVSRQEAYHTDPSGADLVELTSADPAARRYALEAYRERQVITALTVVGAAGLVAGLVMGFATDPTQEGVRIAGYSIVGGAIGLGAIALGLGYALSVARRKALQHLAQFADTCQE